MNEFKNYLITIHDKEWPNNGGKYSYVMGTNNIESIRQALKEKYDRFTIEQRPSASERLKEYMNKKKEAKK